MTRKLFIKTFGCQMNEYDTSRMADALHESHGLERTESPEEADVLLLNTCSVRDKAQEKVFSVLGRWNQLKQARPGLVIGVGGCVASQEGEAIRLRAPYVDMIFGPQTLHRLPEMLKETEQKHKPCIDISFPEIEKFDNLPEPRAEGPTAFVSIMEGCSKYCTFCVVPYTRGEEVSRPFDDVIAEVAGLAAQGVREVNLLGQNVNAYRGPMHDGDVADLALLIRYVAAIDGIDRIPELAMRFVLSNPNVTMALSGMSTLQHVEENLTVAADTVTLWGTGKPMREFLHVDDMADACVFVMNLPDDTVAAHFTDYPRPSFANVGTGIDVTIRELAETVKETTGFTGTIVWDTAKPDGTPRKLLDVSRLRALGWEAKIPLREGVRSAYQWFLDHVDTIRSTHP